LNAVEPSLFLDSFWGRVFFGSEKRGDVTASLLNLLNLLILWNHRAVLETTVEGVEIYLKTATNIGSEHLFRGPKDGEKNDEHSVYIVS